MNSWQIGTMLREPLAVLKVRLNCVNYSAKLDRIPPELGTGEFDGSGNPRQSNN